MVLLKMTSLLILLVSALLNRELRRTKKSMIDPWIFLKPKSAANHKGRAEEHDVFDKILALKRRRVWNVDEADVQQQKQRE